MQLLTKNTKKTVNQKVNIYHFILNLIWIAGFLFFYQSITGLNISYLGIISLAILSLYTLIDYMMHSKKSKIMISVIALIVIILFIPFIYRGLLGLVQCIIHLYNIKYEDAFNLTMTIQTSNLDMMIFTLFFLLLICYYVYRCIKNRSLIFIHILFFIVIFASMWLGVFSYIVMGLMTLSQVGLWIMNYNDFISWRIRIWLMSFMAVFIALTSIFSYRDEQTIGIIKNMTASKIDTLRYGEDTLPKGDLTQATNIHLDDEIRLKVSTLQIKDFYLKGYVGSRLVDNKWSDLKRADYNGNHQGMLNWLENKGFYTTQQFNQYLSYDHSQDIKSNELTIENVAANRKYYYAPYSIDYLSRKNVTQVKDQNLVSTTLFGSDNYDYQEYSQNLPCELLNTTDLTKQAQPSKKLVKYNKSENIYRQFVYDKYLDVDHSLLSSIQSLFDQQQFKNTGIYSVSQHIRSILSQNMTYSEKSIHHKNKNELLAFLNETRQGNDVLFASVGVEAFRYYGIPARYVEGYLAKSSSFNKQGKVTLTSKNAHAWVEVYFDGIGWMPIDVTPGYYYDTYALMSMLNQSQGVKEASAKKDDSKKAKAVDNQGSSSVIKQAKKVIQKLENIFIGFAFFLGIILIIFVIILEMRRTLYQMKLYRLYRQSSQNQQTRILYLIIKQILAIYGVECYVGWKDQENDQLLLHKQMIHEGEYLRVIHLLEKFFYGEKSLEVYEFNIISRFVETLYQHKKNVSLYQKCKLHFVLVSKKLFKQIDNMNNKGGKQLEK